MHSILQERCELEFERYVAEIRDSRPDHLDMITVRTPWSDGLTIMLAGIPYLIRDIRTALDAVIWFDKHGPSWAGRLPMGNECIALLRASGPQYLLGNYAFSLQLLNYDYLTHPQLYDFCCGATAHPSAPEHVRTDELLAEFPPKPLPGLSARLIWFENLQTDKLINS